MAASPVPGMCRGTQGLEVCNAAPPAPRSSPDTLGSLIWLPQGSGGNSRDQCPAHHLEGGVCKAVSPLAFHRQGGLTTSSTASCV